VAASTRHRVIIIGAGMAGMAAADRLQKSGVEIQVVEARTRPGGRIETLRDFADGMYAEAGAMSIPDTHTRALTYIAELNLSVRTHFGRRREASLFLIDGHRVRITPGKVEQWPATLRLTAEERAIGLAGMQQKYLDAFIPQVGDPFSPAWPPPHLLLYDSMTAEDFFLSQGASPAAAQLLSMALYNLDGDGARSFSALLMLATEASVYKTVRSFVPAGGMDQLPIALGLKLRKHIYYGAPATRIEQDASGIRVAIRPHGTTEWLTGDYVVCAIPFPVLRQMEVTPAFSLAKKKVIDEQPLTSVTRVFVQTREQFWGAEHLNGATCTNLQNMNTYSAYQQAAQRGILECYSAGQNARHLAALPVSTRDDLVVRQMAEPLQGLATFAEGNVTRIWDEDPWAKGAYAWSPPGRYVEFLRASRQAEGRIFFAGDQTSALPGWIEAAVESGHRAAHELLARAHSRQGAAAGG
jgi:monoamine oxidase